MTTAQTATETPVTATARSSETRTVPTTSTARRSASDEEGERAGGEPDRSRGVGSGHGCRGRAVVGRGGGGLDSGRRDEASRSAGGGRGVGVLGSEHGGVLRSVVGLVDDLGAGLGGALDGGGEEGVGEEESAEEERDDEPCRRAEELDAEVAEDGQEQDERDFNVHGGVLSADAAAVGAGGELGGGAGAVVGGPAAALGGAHGGVGGLAGAAGSGGADLHGADAFDGVEEVTGRHDALSFLIR